jgi:hypothetical protein
VPDDGMQLRMRLVPSSVVTDPGSSLFFLAIPHPPVTVGGPRYTQAGDVLPSKIGRRLERRRGPARRQRECESPNEIR